MKKICSRCKGQGAYWTWIRKGSQLESHYVTCDGTGCENGAVDSESEYRKIMSWGLTNTQKDLLFQV